MDALITNLSASPVFVPGPNVELDATGGTYAARTWTDVTIADLDGSPRIKALVVAGTISISLTDDAADLAVAVQGSMQHFGLPAYAFADLPTGFEGRLAFATDGRRTGQGGGSGTGVPVYWSSTAWRVFFDDTAAAV